jgi:hypothetical protein
MDSPMDDLISPQAAIDYLKAAANYFLHRDTKGEDAAFWANVQNAENCRRIARLIESIMTEQELMDGLEAAGLTHSPQVLQPEDRK